MNREEKIKAIKDKIGYKREFCLQCDNELDGELYCERCRKGDDELKKYTEIDDVMLGDVLDYVDINFEGKEMFSNYKEVLYHTAFRRIFDLWENKREILEKQSERCVNCIYDLIKE